jgi:hypothetical protein
MMNLDIEKVQFGPPSIIFLGEPFEQIKPLHSHLLFPEIIRDSSARAR